MATGYDTEEITREDAEGSEDALEDSAEGAGPGDVNSRLANRRRGRGTGNPGKTSKKLADLQSQFGVALKVRGVAVFICCSVLVSPVHAKHRQAGQAVLHVLLWEIEAYAWMAFMSVLLTAGGRCSSFFVVDALACGRTLPTS